MKKLTLMTLLAAFVCVSAFAQKGMKQLPRTKALVERSFAITKGMDRRSQPARKANRRANEELVTPPSTATTETWYTVDGQFYISEETGWGNYTSEMPSITVAIDGSDIYVQGLAFFFEDGWIKGTISGTTATFANGQLIGTDEYGPEYIVGSDDMESLSDNIVFNYNAEEGILEAATAFIFENAEISEIAPYTFWHQPTFSTTMPAAPEVVTVPEELVVEEYFVKYLDSDGSEGYGVFNIGFDGNDVYLQGLCTYLPEAWIKGTLDGTTITFAGNQYMGKYGEKYDIYFQTEDAVFTYDAEAAKLTNAGEVYTYTGEQTANYYADIVITKVVEKAATPATPSITQFGETQYGTAMAIVVPNVDEEGNGLLSSKLTYQFFVDVEGEVTPLTFSAADYKYLEEDMTVIPYGFTDDYDFYSDFIYLNMETSSWNRIGIQSTYTGGNEEHKSEISWCTLKEYGSVAFDFNAMTDEPCSANGDNSGDITEERTLTEGVVSLTISTSTTSTPNRFWNTNNGPQLRVYGGTLTFEVPSNKVIKEIVFNAGRWNANNSADTGAFDGSKWTGEAQKVVVTIAGNTQLNSIEVATADIIPEAIVAPENLVTEPYSFKATSIDFDDDDNLITEPYETQVQVGFDGNDLYIQGIAEDSPELWIKATMNADGKYVVPANQYMGTLDFFGLMSYDFFFTSFDDEGNLTDVVFNFDLKNQTLSTEQYVCINSDMTEVAPYYIYTDVVITKINEIPATPVSPTVMAVGLSDNDEPYADFVIPATGTNGETLIYSKLFYTVWIEKDGQQQQYTFTADDYSYDFDEDVTEVPYTYDGYDIYAYGNRVYFEVEAEEFKSWSKVGVQAIYYVGGQCYKSEIAWSGNETYEDSSAISGITASQTGKSVIYNIAGQRLSAPKKGLNIINGRKIVVK